MTSARAPRTKRLIRHHSSSPRRPRRPRPRPSNTPPRQTSSDTLTHRPCQPPDGGGGHGGLEGEDDDSVDDSVRGVGDEGGGERERDGKEMSAGRRQSSGGSQVDDGGGESTRRADEAPCSVRVVDTGSGVCLEAVLNRPFDQLASARLRAVARLAARQKLPTSLGGGRHSLAETDMGANSQGEGLCSDAVVPPAGFEPARP